MPNWCDNQITITGPNSVIDKIEKIVKEEDKSDIGFLQFLHPMPDALKNTTADGSKKPELKKLTGHDDWYSWCTDNWGTKWDINEFYGVDRKDNTISFAFSSAWAPPLGAFEHFLGENDNCSIKAYYYEGGCDFAGVWEDGADTCIAPSEYNSKDDFWKDGLGYELEDQFNLLESMAEYEAEQEEDVTKYVKGQKVNIGEEA